MRFSNRFGIQRSSDDDWFDTILTIDTPLFIDPFLLYASETGHFLDSHSEVIAFFNSVFQMVSQSGGERKSMAWRRHLCDGSIN